MNNTTDIKSVGIKNIQKAWNLKHFTMCMCVCVRAHAFLCACVYVCGVQPSKPYKSEGWEVLFVGGMSVSFFLMYYIAKHGPDTSPQRWAREEALHSGFQAPKPAPDLED